MVLLVAQLHCHSVYQYFLALQADSQHSRLLIPAEAQRLNRPNPYLRPELDVPDSFVAEIQAQLPWVAVAFVSLKQAAQEGLNWTTSKPILLSLTVDRFSSVNKASSFAS